MTKQEYLEENLKDFQKKIKSILTTQDLPKDVRKEINNKYIAYEEILKTTLAKMGIPTTRYSSYHEEAMEQSGNWADRIYQKECEAKAIELERIIENLQERGDLNSRQKEARFMDSCYTTMHNHGVEDRRISYGEMIAEDVAEHIVKCRRTMDYVFAQSSMSQRTADEYREQVRILLEDIRNKMPDTIEQEMLQRIQENLTQLENAYQQYEQEEERIEDKPMTLEDKREKFTSSLAATEEVKQKLSRVVEDEQNKEKKSIEEKEELEGEGKLPTDIII